MTGVQKRWRRLRALMRKETLQILRDRATLGMLLGIPLLQIIIFGFAIGLTPEHLSITLISAAGPNARITSLLPHLVGPARLARAATLEDAQASMARGTTDLIIDLVHEPRTVYVDGSNPIVAALSELKLERFLRSTELPLEPQEAEPSPVRIERLYDSHESAQPYLLTGLMGAIPTMSLVMMAALTLARERERATLVVLRASPVRFFEVLSGKLLPYLFLGLIQCSLILIVIRVLFHLGFNGAGLLVALATILFAAANLTLGFFFSCLARQQLQAAQLTFFFFLPSSLLSGFMFPFSAMPLWAQRIGEILPMTHYLRITRGVMLRGAESGYVAAQSLPIAAFAAFMMLGAYWVWRRGWRR
jgi:ABC-2 type transport system permease protein